MHFMKKQTTLSGLIPQCNSLGLTEPSLGYFFDTYITETGEKAPRAVALWVRYFPTNERPLVRSSLDPTQKKYLRLSRSQCSCPSLFTISWESLALLCSHSNEKYHCWELMFKKDRGWKERRVGGFMIFTNCRPPELKVGRNTLDSSFYEGFEVLVL